MKCEDCEKGAQWRIDDGVNAWGSIIFLSFCDGCLKKYQEKVAKLKRGVHLYDKW